MKDICIYGFGVYGVRIYYILTERGVKVKCFADYNPDKQGYALGGIDCISYDDVLALDRKNTVLVIAIKSSYELIQEFIRMGFSYVYDQKEVIEKLSFGNESEPDRADPIHSIEIIKELEVSLRNVIYQNIEKEFVNRDMQQIVNDYAKRNKGLVL